tara:strand:- start:275 stop:469 length:195 start_codon:yes stop_codon:yes gene_type:complete
LAQTYKQKINIMELENHKEETTADKLADKIAANLFLNKLVTVTQANGIYYQVKKILLEDMLRSK